MKTNPHHCAYIRTPWNILVSTILTLSASHTAHTAETGFRVTGTLTHTIHIEGFNNPPAKSNFEVSVSDRLWRIHETPLNTNSLISSYESGTDGKKSYSVSRYNLTNMDAQQALNDAGGTVTKGTLPAHGYGNLATLWLAFASRHYFAGKQDSKLPRFQLANDLPQIPPEDDLISASWAMFDDGRGLPKTIEFLNDGTKRNFDPFTKNVSAGNHLPPYDQGFVMARYQATESTNLLGTAIPTRFSFQRLVPNPSGKTVEDTRVIAEITGVVHQISGRIEPVSFVPKLEVSTHIYDRTVKPAEEVEATGYHLSAGNQWLDDENVRKTKAFARQRTTTEMQRRFASAATESARSPWAIWLLFLLSTATLLFVITRKRSP